MDQAQPVPATPAGSSSSGGLAAEKEKRKVGSCSACYVRKVKCIKSAGSDTCNGCMRKGIVCTPGVFAPRKSAKNPKLAETALVHLSPTSKTAGLVDAQLQGGLISSIIDIVFELPDSRLPILKETRIVQSFEGVARRPELLDDVASALLSVVTAVGSRVSDNPFLAGSRAPRLKDLNNPGLDLVACGQQRNAACRSLMMTAVKRIDESGMMHKPSLESLTSFFVMGGLISQEKDLAATSKAYAATCMSHLRSLLKDPETPPAVLKLLSEGEIGWSLFCRDALRSTLDEHGALLTDEDVDLLIPDYVLPIHEIFKPNTFQQVDPFEAFFATFRATAYFLSMSARKASRTITGHKAMKRKLDEPALREFLSDMSLVGAAVPILEAKATAIVGPAGSSSLHFSTNMNMLLWSLVRVVRFSRAAQLLVPYRVVLQRLAMLPAQISPDTPLDPFWGGGHILGDTLELLRAQVDSGKDAAYAFKLRAIADEASVIAFKTVRELATLIEDLMTTGLPLLTIPAMANDLFHRAKIWVQPLIACPAAEQGGPVDFTFKDKVRELEMVLKGARFAAWSYDLEHVITWLQSQLETVKATKALYDQALFAPVPSFSHVEIDPAIYDLVNSAFGSDA